MVWSNDRPPEKEHPLTTLGACGIIFVMGFFGTKWGWAALRFAGLLVGETPGSIHEVRVSFGLLVIGGSLTIVGLAFMAGAVRCGGRARRSMLGGAARWWSRRVLSGLAGVCDREFIHSIARGDFYVRVHDLIFPDVLQPNG